MVEPLACVVRGVEESWIGRGPVRRRDRRRPHRADVRGARPHARRPRRGRRPQPRAAREGPRDGRRGRSSPGRAATTWSSSCGSGAPRAAGGRGGRGRRVARDLRGRRSRRPQGWASSTSSAAAPPTPGSASTRSTPLSGADDQVDLPPHSRERAQVVPAGRRRPHRPPRTSSAARRHSKACPRCWARWPAAARAEDGHPPLGLT